MCFTESTPIGSGSLNPLVILNGLKQSEIFGSVLSQFKQTERPTDKCLPRYSIMLVLVVHSKCQKTKLWLSSLTDWVLCFNDCFWIRACQMKLPSSCSTFSCLHVLNVWMYFIRQLCSLSAVTKGHPVMMKTAQRRESPVSVSPWAL